MNKKFYNQIVITFIASLINIYGYGNGLVIPIFFLQCLCNGDMQSVIISCRIIEIDTFITVFMAVEYKKQIVISSSNSDN